MLAHLHVCAHARADTCERGNVDLLQLMPMLLLCVRVYERGVRGRANELASELASE